MTWMMVIVGLLAMVVVHPVIVIGVISAILIVTVHSTDAAIAVWVVAVGCASVWAMGLWPRRPFVRLMRRCWRVFPWSVSRAST